MPDVFISYSRRDLEFVRRLHDALVTRGKDVWVDWEDIPPTAEWLQEVFEGIEASDNFLFVITPNSLTSDVCERELRHALARQKRLVPILRRDADGTRVPEALASRNWTFFRDEDAFAHSLDSLVAALDTDLEWVSEHTRLLGRSLEWEKEGRDSSFLLRGRDLADAEHWVASQTAEHEPRPTSLQMEYVLASRSAATRRQRVVIGVALGGAVIAAGLAVFAWSQRNEAIDQRQRAERQARLALSRQLAAESIVALKSDPQQSLVLASDAATTAGTSEAVDALRSALLNSRLRSLVETGAQVNGIAVDPKGRLVAAALENGRMRIWNVRTRKPVLTRRLPADSAWSVSFSHDGSLVLGAGKGGVSIWSTSPNVRRPLASFDRSGEPAAVAVSPNGKLVATGDHDGVVRLWRIATRMSDPRTFRPPGGRSPVTAVAFSADGSRVAATNAAHTAVWSLRTKRPILRARENDWAVDFSPDGLHVAAGDERGVIRVWNLRTGHAVTIRGHEGRITALAYSADGRSLVSASEDETGRIWDPATGSSLAELRGHDGLVLSAVFAPDGKSVLTGGQDGTIRTWAANLDPIRAELAAPDKQELRDVSFDPSGEHVVAASQDLSAFIWDIRSGRRLSLPHAHRKDAWVESAQFSHDGRLVLTAGDDGRAKVWDASNGALLRTLRAPGGEPLQDAAFSPDGRLVAAGGASSHVIRLWQWRQGKPLADLGGFADGVRGVAFSPAGGLVAGAGTKAVRVWRVGERAPFAVLRSRERSDRLTSVAFDPSGRLVAAGSSSGAAWIWDLATKKPVVRIIRHDDDVSDVGFSFDGRYLVTTTRHSGFASVSTVPGGHFVTEIRPSAASLQAASFAPHRRDIAVAGAGGRITLFDCAECRPLRSLVCLAATRVTPEIRAQARKTFRRCT
jgi:WD40 repeat protein